MKKYFFILFLIIIFCSPTMAYKIDTSINKEIQTKYNANKLNEDMQVSSPQDIIKNKNTKDENYSTIIKVPKSTLIYDNQTPTVTADHFDLKKYGKKLSKWSTFKVKSNQKISDYLTPGTHVSFTTTTTVNKKSIIIPAGAVFHGEISKVHHPQISGNGALVEIKITSLTFNGKTYSTEGKITKADTNLIFFNKIKGNRQYLNGVENNIKKANNFYNKSRQISNKLSKNPVSSVLSRIPTVVGLIGSSAGTITAPITGIARKGKNISLPAGTNFEIKLTQNTYIY